MEFLLTLDEREDRVLKKIKRSIFICICLFLLFLVCYIFILFGKEKTNNRVEGVIKTYFELKNNDLQFVEIEKKGEEPFRIFYSNKETKNSYKINGFNNVPINNVDCESVFNFIKKIESSHIFSPKTDLKDYGLVEPEYIFRAKDRDGKSFVFKVGKKNLAGDGYYIKREGDGNEKIAVISSLKLFPILKDKLGYVDLRLISSYSKTFGDDGKYNKDGVQACNIKRKGFDETLKFSVNDEGKVVVVAPKNFELKENIAESVEKAPALLVAKQAYKVSPTEEEFKACGINNPGAVVEYLIDDKKYVIKIGDVCKADHLTGFNEEDGNVRILKYYYVYINTADVIYIVGENLLPWLEF